MATLNVYSENIDFIEQGYLALSYNERFEQFKVTMLFMELPYTYYILSVIRHQIIRIDPPNNPDFSHTPNILPSKLDCLVHISRNVDANFCGLFLQMLISTMLKIVNTSKQYKKILL